MSELSSCALRRVYPPETEWTTFHSSHRTVWSRETTSNTVTGITLEKIPKPRGDVACISRGGYSLRKVLGWDDEFYKEVQVCPLCSEITTH